MERIQELLKDMDVPDARRKDFRWLLRNLFVRNSKHPNFEEACGLLKEMVASERK